MQPRFVPLERNSTGEDPSFFLNSVLEVERTIWRLRWVALVGGPVLALIAGLVAAPALLLGAAAIGGSINLIVGYLLRAPQHLLSRLSQVTALLDVALLSGFVAALKEPVNRYAHLYLLCVATAAMRFGFVGTVATTAVAWIGLMSTFWLTHGVPDDLRSQVIYPTLLLAAASLLLGQFAQQVKEWLKEGMQRERHLEQQLTELAVLQEVNNAVYDLKSGDTLQNIVEVCTKVLDFRRAALFLSTEQEGMPDRYYSSRLLEDFGRPEKLLPLHFDRHLFEAMLQADRPFVVDGSQGSEMMARGPLLEIAVPLRNPNGPIGVLVVDCDDRTKVSENDIEVLSALANSATLAIENAQAHNQAQWRASHDGLTNLYNHGYFQETLRQEAAQSRAKNYPLALLMVELDNFKRYNDTYGHRQGDMALVSVARTLEVCVEQWQGTVARYGGDEFVVILAGLDRSEALHAAHQVQNWIRDMTATELGRHDLSGITVSVGVAVFPADAKNAAQLIEAADQAMYVAKHRGGDQVETFSQIGNSASPLASGIAGVTQKREQEKKR
jgi:diguanylate cyclase (GGDEF)-like protein